MEEQLMYSKHGGISAVAAAEDLESSCLNGMERLRLNVLQILHGKRIRALSCKHSCPVI